MNHSLVGADRNTHFKIIAVALVSAIVLVVVGLIARTDTSETGPPSSRQRPGAEDRQVHDRHHPGRLDGLLTTALFAPEGKAPLSGAASRPHARE